ncbi:hypothetical protein EMCRGX_G012947 [Ephydatia muelleri]
MRRVQRKVLRWKDRSYEFVLTSLSLNDSQSHRIHSTVSTLVNMSSTAANTSYFTVANAAFTSSRPSSSPPPRAPPPLPAS